MLKTETTVPAVKPTTIGLEWRLRVQDLGHKTVIFGLRETQGLVIWELYGVILGLREVI